MAALMYMMIVSSKPSSFDKKFAHFSVFIRKITNFLWRPSHIQLITFSKLPRIMKCGFGLAR